MMPTHWNSRSTGWKQTNPSSLISSSAQLILTNSPMLASFWIGPRVIMKDKLHVVWTRRLPRQAIPTRRVMMIRPFMATSKSPPSSKLPFPTAKATTATSPSTTPTLALIAPSASPLTNGLTTQNSTPTPSASTDVDETSGDLIAYVPLSTVYSQAGDSPVAFECHHVSTQPYPRHRRTSPTGANAHQYRLAWMVQMITDDCVADHR